MSAYALRLSLLVISALVAPSLFAPDARAADFRCSPFKAPEASDGVAGSTRKNVIKSAWGSAPYQITSFVPASWAQGCLYATGGKQFMYLANAKARAHKCTPGKETSAGGGAPSSTGVAQIKVIKSWGASVTAISTWVPDDWETGCVFDADQGGATMFLGLAPNPGGGGGGGGSTPPVVSVPDPEPPVVDNGSVSIGVIVDKPQLPVYAREGETLDKSYDDFVGKR